MPPKSSKTAGAEALKKGTAQPIGNFFKAQKKAGRPRTVGSLSATCSLGSSGVQRTTTLNLTAEDYAMVTVVRDSFGEGGKQKLAKRKLGSVGYVRSSCGMANDPARIKRLRERLMLASSLAEIFTLASNEKSAKSSLAAAALIDKAPSAVAKLKGQGGLVSALAMGEVIAKRRSRLA